ncbi:hypothetical protein AUK40_03045 [Candidatus Wirthbacteria bacterium CG2_30_54_11]|uniref:Uncharacterized protein n=1 Tax=Candidatus Wirthbacteria bacterium CG2_30_54_11 TaxID=1817892 RepID=A0A1J5IZ17_9BACT|nr:MAG: hypothetical protein AUK40_03045 [Candidatus Wirthbacteria bacterium CG2_30_54_11]
MDQKDVRVIKQFAAYLEQIKFDQYLARQSNTKKVLWYNLIAGVAHGFGYIIGATIFIAYFWLILEWLGGLPWVGRIIAQIVEIVLRHQMSS